MTANRIEVLKKWLTDLALLIDKNDEPDPHYFAQFLQEPDLALHLVGLIAVLDEKDVDDNRSYYSACVFALDICVAQLEAANEAGIKLAGKTLNQLMASLAEAIASRKQSLSFWLPILNAFYEVHVELSEELKNAYLDLASEDGDLTPEEEESHLDSIRDLIHELSDLSVFDITENFFAQSYAMPADFFADLVLDLYSIEEGQDIALLTLLHPKQDVRDVVVATHEQLMDNITLSSISLSRLQTIKNWYPEAYHAQFDRWIKVQRKKGVVYSSTHRAGGQFVNALQTKETDGLLTRIVGLSNRSITQAMRIKASEVDGSGAQGIFIHLKKNRKHRLCGLLFKQEVGIKDAWITPVISMKDIERYYEEAFDDSVMLRDVDMTYIQIMTGHFLALTIERHEIPDLHLLEMQEELDLHWFPRKLDVPYLLEHLAVQISPFNPESIQASFLRSKSWTKNKRFTESWYVENAQIDKLVNRCCSFIDGVKVCRFEEAEQAVLSHEMECNREHWLFHFLWVSLWLKAKARKNEKVWQDSFMIAYAIHGGTPLADIPIMHEICHQSVVNSIETMQERRTHLNRE